MNNHLKLFAALLLLAGCNPSRSASETSGNITFPYVAGEARRSQIINAVSRIAPGMSLAEAQAIAGKPDVVRPLYEPQLKNPDQIGNTYWYYLQIDDAARPQDGALMRISADNRGVVTKVDHWGFELE